MFQEVIEAVDAAENAARVMREEAVLQTKLAVEDAIKVGEAKVQAAAQKAQAEHAEMIQKAEEDAAQQVEDIISSTKNKIAIMNARAEGKMQEAVDFVVGRIVNA